MKVLCPAKLNLSLRLCHRRDDGYHELDSLVCFINLYDTLTLFSARQTTLDCRGRYAEALQTQPMQDNIVIRALRLLQQADAAIGEYAVQLEKNIPIGAGLGGGSSDAASMLRMLGSHLPHKVIIDMALQLGADVPVCLARRSVRVRGIGEDLSHFSLPRPLSLLLVCPAVSLSTAAVFRAASVPVRGNSSHDKQPGVDPATWYNDLQATAINLCPDIANIINHLQQQPYCLYAGMTGSGSCCFGVFTDNSTRDQAAQRLHRQGDWYIHCGQTLSPSEDHLVFNVAQPS